VNVGTVFVSELLVELRIHDIIFLAVTMNFDEFIEIDAFDLG